MPLRLTSARQPGRVRIELTDYRDVGGRYRRGRQRRDGRGGRPGILAVYLESIARLLKPGGRAAIQLISIRDELFEDYAANADFIQAYVFPGGMLIGEADSARCRGRGLDWRDRAGFGLHYAETLKRWRAPLRRMRSAEGRLPAGFDRRFDELWRYYLMYCEGGFRGGGIWVAQVTLVEKAG